VSVIGQLSAPQAINELVQVGLVRSQTGWMLDLLSDPAVTGAVIVSAPEEMPVNETIELAARLRSETQVDLAAVVVNRVLPESVAEWILLKIEPWRVKSGKSGKFPAFYHWCYGPTTSQIRRLATAGFAVEHCVAYFGESSHAPGRLLKKADHDRIVQVAKEAIAREGKIRALLILEGFEGWERHEGWGNVSFMMEEGRDIEKMAIVGDEKWKDDVIAFTAKGFRPTAIEFFAASRVTAARVWVNR